jgi:hypothetical protein
MAHAMGYRSFGPPGLASMPRGSVQGPHARVVRMAGRAEVYFLASAGALVETAVKTMPVLMFRPGRAS